MSLRGTFGMPCKNNIPEGIVRCGSADLGGEVHGLVTFRGCGC